MLKNDTDVLKNAKRYLTEFKKFNISIITYYEALSGLKYAKATNKIARLEYFAKNNNVIEIDKDIVQSAVNIYVHLRQEGMLISQADILIAGTAKSKNLALITNNVSHFERIPDLAIENWHKDVIG